MLCSWNYLNLNLVFLLHLFKIIWSHGNITCTVKDKNEMQLVSDMLKKMRITTKRLSEEEREDLRLSKMMKQAKRSEKVSKEQVMKTLRGE